MKSSSEKYLDDVIRRRNLKRKADLEAEAQRRKRLRSLEKRHGQSLREIRKQALDKKLDADTVGGLTVRQIIAQAKQGGGVRPGGALFEKAATYILRQNDVYYEGVKRGAVEFGGSREAGGVDGTDAQAVAQAISDALFAAGGGRAVAMDGVFDVLGTPINLKTNVEWFGLGRATIFRDSVGVGAGDTSVFKILGAGAGDRYSNIRISNMTLESTATPKAGTHGITGTYIEDCMFDHILFRNLYEEGVALTKAASRCWIVDNKFNNTGAAAVNININSDYNFISRNIIRDACAIEGVASSAILLWEGGDALTCDYNTIAHNKLIDCLGIGIRLRGVKETTVFDNNITNCVGNSILVTGTVTGTNNNRIEANTISQPNDTAIHIRDHETRVLNNTIVGNSLQGIRLNGAINDCLVSGNSIKDCSIAIVLDNAASYNDIIGNTIKDSVGSDPSGTGILLDTNSNYNKVSENKSRGHASFDLICNGQNNEIHFNSFLSTVAVKTGANANNKIYANEGNVGLYQTQSGGWANPSGVPGNGTRVLVYNSTQGAERLYGYSNGAWVVL